MPFAFDPLYPSTSTDAGALATEAQSADGSSSTAFVSNSSCAACGKSNAGDDILKMCVACKAVKYCSRECQRGHWPLHKTACKKRSKAIKDTALFKDPPPSPDCPICFHRLEAQAERSNYQLCCGTKICNGCLHSMIETGVEHWRAGNTIAKASTKTNCPFCRMPCHDTDEEGIARLNKLLEVNPNNPEALHFLAFQYINGSMGLRQDTATANKLWKKAGAELGNGDALNSLANSHSLGRGMAVDKKKAVHYYELAAMKGHAQARFNLGIFQLEDEDNVRKVNEERALKHWMISAKSGFKPAVDKLQLCLMHGLVEKDVLTVCLNEYNEYLDEVTSDQRKAALEKW